jgi:hypothetical protein
MLSPRRIGIAVWSVDALLLVVAVALQLATWGSNAGLAAPMSANVVFVIWGAAYATVGALIGSRRPENAVGWLFLAAGSVFALCAAAFAYADRGLAPGQSLPGDTAALWIADCPSAVALGLSAVALLLFPDGALPSRRWRPVFAVQVAATAALAAGLGLLPGTLDANVDVPNPLGVGGAYDLLNAVQGVGWGLQVVSVAAAGAAIFVRLRRSGGTTREQLKWVAYAGSVLAVIWLPWTASFALPQPRDPFPAIAVAVASLAVAAIPVSAGIAILRHRLYEIDVIIRRTLIYASLVAALGVIYLIAITLIGHLLQLATGQSGALAVTVSTLLVAGAFQPLRTRIQRAVDRRFYRRTLDSAHALQAFAGRMRDQVDLDSVQSEVLAVVRATVQPHHASLWLRPSQERATRPPTAWRSPAR